MFEYMTVQEAAKLWEISERRIQKLCEENRIDGVVYQRPGGQKEMDCR